LDDDGRQIRFATAWACVAIVLLTALYCTLVVLRIDNVNTAMEKADQSAYLIYARKMRLSDYSYAGGRNQMPVFPLLVSLVDEPGLSLDSLFRRAKYLNLALSLLVLVGVFGLSIRLMPKLESCTFVAISAFTVFVYRAGYAQAEVLFYFLFFLCFLGMQSLLRRASLPVAAATGVCLGLAWLTKASVLPLLLLFLGWGGVGLLIPGIRQWGRWAGPGGRASHATCLLLVAGFFILTTSPYLHTSYQRFGSGFYNVNTTFYIWTDSWKDTKELMSGTGDREHWPDLAPAMTPGPMKYLREHSAGEIADRVAAGFYVAEVRHLFRPFGFGKYLALYFALCCMIALRAGRQLAEIIRREIPPASLGFAASCLVAYMLAYAFYAPIVRGPRLMLSMFLPTLFSFFWILSRPAVREAVLFRSAGCVVRVRDFHMGVLALLLREVLFKLPALMTSDFYSGA
jgi:hypothetical protein